MGSNMGVREKGAFKRWTGIILRAIFTRECFYPISLVDINVITHGYSQDKIQEVIGYHQTTILYLSRINIMRYLSLSLPRLSPKIFLVILLENAKNHKALNVLPEWIMQFCKVFLNFDSEDKIPWSDHSS